MITIEITGIGGTINYPKEVIVKALKEAGLQVEVQIQVLQLPLQAHTQLLLQQSLVVWALLLLM